MKTIRHPQTLHKIISQDKRKGSTVGFVPTMGALHEGHLSLVRKARRENDRVVVSIFVNPTQFGPREDLGRYPRPKARDLSLCRQEDVDLVFYPDVKDMYPAGAATTIEVARGGDVLCGRSRPGHFRGVATVVCKLLHIVGPDTLYLGQKDFQQCVVIKQMVRDLNLFVRVRVCRTVREPDGLALSSRNRYLTVQQRRHAPQIHRVLQEAKAMILTGATSPRKTKSYISSTIEERTGGRMDYAEVLAAESLEPLRRFSGEVLLACAVFLGRTRLIDNLTVKIKNKKS